jgi:purine nucleosidase
VDPPPPSRQAEAEHAALAILRLSHAHAGELMLVMLGPLTNLALALKLDPTLPQRIKRIVVMGGAVTCHGNITPAAEFNIAFDPEAAHVVFTSFKHLLVSDWEATVAHGLPLEEAEKWLQADRSRPLLRADFAQDPGLSEDSKGGRWYTADAVAMAWALNPEGQLRVESRPLNVELNGTFSRGATIVDWNRQTGQPDNCDLLTAYDQRSVSRPWYARPWARLKPIDRHRCPGRQPVLIMPLLTTSPFTV